jgi:hypothetical protein
MYEDKYTHLVPADWCQGCGEDYHRCICLDDVEDPEPHSIDDPNYFGWRTDY